MCSQVVGSSPRATTYLMVAAYVGCKHSHCEWPHVGQTRDWNFVWLKDQSIGHDCGVSQMGLMQRVVSFTCSIEYWKKKIIFRILKKNEDMRLDGMIGKSFRLWISIIDSLIFGKGSFSVLDFCYIHFAIIVFSYLQPRPQRAPLHKRQQLCWGDGSHIKTTLSCRRFAICQSLVHVT